MLSPAKTEMKHDEAYYRWEILTCCDKDKISFSPYLGPLYDVGENMVYYFM